MKIFADGHDAEQRSKLSPGTTSSRRWLWISAASVVLSHAGCARGIQRTLPGPNNDSAASDDSGIGHSDGHPSDSTGTDAAHDLNVSDSLAPNAWPNLPFVPKANYRSIGKANELFSGQISVAAESDLVTTSSVMSDRIGQGDQITIDQTTQFFIIERIDNTTVRIDRSSAGALNLAPATISRAYSEIDDWDDSHKGDLVGEDRIEIGICYADDTTGDGIPEAFVESASIQDSTTDADHYFWLTVAPIDRHHGLAGVGPRLHPSTPTNAISVKVPYTKIEDLEITGWSGDSVAGFYRAIRIEAAHVEVRRVIIHDGHDNVPTSNGDGIFITGSDSSATITNSVFYNLARAGIYVNSGNNTATVLNSSFYNCRSAHWNHHFACVYLKDETAMARVVNVLAVNPQGTHVAFYTDGSATPASWLNSSHNMSSDTSAPGQSAQFNISPTTEFLSTEADKEDLHLKVGANALGAGTPLAAELEGDIDGEGRSRWDIGADEQR